MKRPKSAATQPPRPGAASARLRKPAAKKIAPSERLISGLPAGQLQFVEPMKCRLVEKLPEGSEWVYEIKFDGFRGLAIRNGNDVRLISRNNKSLADKFPSIIRALRELPAEKFMLDGEVVALDQGGRSSFQLLQSAGEPDHAGALVFYAFDILNLDGKDTTGLPLMERKSLVKTLVQNNSEGIRSSDLLEGDISELSATMQGLGLEGLIAKKRSSKYEPGVRSGTWVKFKWGYEQEFVIGGYTDPEGSRPFFGSVVVGFYESERLVFAAKVGTGFSTKLLKSLYDRFQTIRIEHTPFANLPERAGLLTAAQMRFCKWVAPNLVCQVRFSEWTRDNHLRQPVFLGLREDKAPREVVKEIPQ